MAAGAPTPPPLPEGPRRRGALGRFLWRLIRPFLAPELARLEHRFRSADEHVSAVAGQLEGEARARTELQAHLETRIDQVVGELADLRDTHLATRGQFEEVRDVRLPSLAGDVQAAHRTLEALQDEVEEVRDQRFPRTEQDLAALHRDLLALQGELEGLRDGRLADLEQSLKKVLEAPRGHAGAIQLAVTTLKEELDGLSRERLPRIEGDLGDLSGALARLQEGLETIASRDLARVQEDLAGLQKLAEELRDERLPALAGRTEWLVTRLHEELERTAGLLDRVVAGEPLRVAVDEVTEARLPEALRSSSLRFAEAFRGGWIEILARVQEHVELLRGAGPVLDLGCGRGELLEALQSAGVEASGVDRDPAMVAACRRRGLQVEEGDAVACLAARADGSLGGVTALHLLEHLSVGSWAKVLEGASRALRPGGVLLVECPNPEALRVGANLFWVDPTHHTPVHREALAFVMEACGLTVEVNRVLHPFPPEQMLTSPEQPAAVRELARRLDEWLSAPRDFLLLARRPRS